MRPTVLSRLAARLTERKSGWNVDWVWAAFVLAVLVLIAVGVFMSVAASAHGIVNPRLITGYF